MRLRGLPTDVPGSSFVGSPSGTVVGSAAPTSSKFPKSKPAASSLPRKNPGSVPGSSISLPGLEGGRQRTAFEYVGVEDSLSLVRAVTLPFVDPVGVQDGLTALLVAGVDPLSFTQADPIGITDSLAKAAGRTLVDTVGATDALTKTIGKTSTDSVGVSDSLVKAATRDKTDTVGLTDSASVISGAFVTRDTSTGNLMFNGERLRFAGANIANDIGLVGTDNGNVYSGTASGGSYLTPHAQIDAALDSAELMGPTVLRLFSAADNTNNPLAVQPSLGSFNSAGLEPLDYALQECALRGIKVVIPLSDEYTNKPWYVAQTGGGADSNFITRTATINAFKAHISFVLDHVNVYTGVALKDDATILCWETGNELTGSGASSAAMATWLDDISTYIKVTKAAKQLVMDGFFGLTSDWTTFDTARLAVANCDIYSTHCYDNFRTPANVELEAAAAHAADKAFVIGEWTWTDRGAPPPGAACTWTIDDMIDQVQGSSNIDGDMYWEILAPGTIYYAGYSLHRPADGTCRMENPNFPFTPYFMSIAEEDERGDKLIAHAQVMSKKYVDRVGITDSATFSRPPFVLDTFTGADGVLTSHTGETGATWAHQSGSGTAIASNRVRTNSAWAYASGTPPSADYEVTADMRFVTNIQCGVGPLARMSTSANTCYRIFLFLSGATWFLYLVKHVNGAYTELGNASLGTVSVGSDHTIKLKVAGNQISAYWDGVLKVGPVTDSSITAAGKAGLYGDTVTSSTGVHFSSISAA